MRIKDLHVTRYGPMTPFAHDGFGAFTLVDGPNEQGKTLLIDALFKLLFKKELRRTRERQFGNMTRVAEQPEGYVVIETGDGEVKLGDEDTVSRYFPVEITPDDFRNVFLVRDSDLGIDGEKFFESVSERISGLRAPEIDRLLGIIQHNGRLKSPTPESPLSNHSDHDKIATRVANAGRVVDELRGARATLAAGRFDELAEELAATRARRRALETQRERRRAGEERRRLEQAASALEELEALAGEIAASPAPDPERLTQWQRLDAERANLAEKLAQDAARLKELRERLAESVRASEVARDPAERAAARAAAVRDTMAPLLDRCRHDRIDVEAGDASRRTAWIALGGSVVVLVVALAAWMARPSAVVAVIASAALAACLTAGGFVARHARRRRGLARDEEILRAAAAREGLDGASASEVERALVGLERTAATQREEANEGEVTVRVTRKSVAELEAGLAGHTERMRAVDVALAGLRASTGVEAATAYAEVLDRRREVEGKAASHRELLRGLVPSAREDSPADWRSAIDAGLARLGPPPAEAAPSGSASGLDAAIAECGERERRVDEDLREGRDRLAALHAKAADLGVLDEVPRCRTLSDLDYLADQIEAWCGRVVRRQQVAQEAIRVFAGIAAQERRRVEDLFGPGTTASALFREMTDGRYRAVVYEPDAACIAVERADGKRLEAGVLSGGALDQLHLAVRLSIAERLLPDGAGFLVLDDPFIKADPHRLATLMETLRRFVGKGWQILYFTAKDEVLAALRSDVDARAVQRIALDPTLFARAWDGGRTTKSVPDAGPPGGPGRAERRGEETSRPEAH